eukprot:scaffold4274_cov267-Pinguiococcus_pyrenoidosus.AAC.2
MQRAKTTQERTRRGDAPSPSTNREETRDGKGVPLRLYALDICALGASEARHGRLKRAEIDAEIAAQEAGPSGVLLQGIAEKRLFTLACAVSRARHRSPASAARERRHDLGLHFTIVEPIRQGAFSPSEGSITRAGRRVRPLDCRAGGG